MPFFEFTRVSLLRTPRSLSELEGLRVGSGDVGEKFRQVTERATLFRITSNAMINVCVGEEQRTSLKRVLLYYYF